MKSKNMSLQCLLRAKVVFFIHTCKFYSKKVVFSWAKRGFSGKKDYETVIRLKKCVKKDHEMKDFIIFAPLYARAFVGCKRTSARSIPIIAKKQT